MTAREALREKKGHHRKTPPPKGYGVFEIVKGVG
jgi:hypothetical protein